MIKKVLSLSCLSCICLLGSTVAAHADEIFIGSQAGLNAFNVDLSTVGTLGKEILVTVTLTDGATAFANTGNGTDHPGFAFSLSGDPAVTISGFGPNWELGATNDTTNGIALGTFDYTLNVISKGTSGNVKTLSFDVTYSGGITFGDFIKSTGANGGYYFAADILNSAGNTGESGISDPGRTVTPEPSSLMLLGTGIIGAAGMLRRRFLS